MSERLATTLATAETSCLRATVYCYLEFKLRYLKNLKLFTIGIKNYLSLQFCAKKKKKKKKEKKKRKKAGGFLLFLKAFSWETRSLSNTRWFGRENLYLTEKRVETKCGVRWLITIKVQSILLTFTKHV